MSRKQRLLNRIDRNFIRVANEDDVTANTFVLSQLKDMMADVEQNWDRTPWYRRRRRFHLVRATLKALEKENGKRLSFTVSNGTGNCATWRY